MSDFDAVRHSSLVSTLRLPLSDGTPGPAIELPYGIPADQGGTGLDWITAFAAPTTGALQVSARQLGAR
jgi:hypothetical protein